MGQRGPAPKPAEIKQRLGTFRPDRDKRVAIGPPVETIPPPAHLTFNQEVIWEEQVAFLAEAGVLRQVDRFAIEAMVIAIEGWRICLGYIETEGWVIDNKITGGVTQRQAHPLIVTMRGFQADYYRWCSKFGLTPSDRTAIGMQEIKSKKMMHSLRESLGEPELKPAEKAELEAVAEDVVDAEVVGEDE